MVQLILGKKGKGKTKIILDMVNKEVNDAKGNIVYVLDYEIANADEFIGFIRGIVSQDHDLEQIYFDSFLKIAQLEASDRIEEVVAELDQISDKYGFKIVASVSLDEAELPEALKSKVIVSL